MSLQVALIALALTSQSGPLAPDAWTQSELEAATEEIRVELEDLRGQSFTGPVAVRLADGDEFLGYAKQRVEAFTTPEQWDADNSQARLLGLIPADMDLLATTYSLLESQVGGFYDPASDTFFLMETYTGGLARVILSHELVHALDDQLFDLDQGMRERVDSTDALFAYQALCEGSAQFISSRWVMRNAGELTAEDLEKASLGTEKLAEAPAFLWKPLLAAYLAGNNFLDRGYRFSRRKLRKEASQGRTIGEAFAAPPLSSEQVLHPEKYWVEESRDDPLRVTHGAAPEGWQERRRTTLGELTLAILVDDDAALAGPDLSNPRSLLQLEYTNAAAEGWGGDEAVLLSKGEADVVHLVTVWDTEADAQEFHDAVNAVGARIRTVAAKLNETNDLRVILNLGARRVDVVSSVGLAAPEVTALLAELSVQVEARVESAPEAAEPVPAGAQ